MRNLNLKNPGQMHNSCCEFLLAEVLQIKFHMRHVLLPTPLQRTVWSDGSDGGLWPGLMWVHAVALLSGQCNQHIKLAHKCAK